MTKTVWRDTATGKIYNISKVEDVATEVIKELSFEEVCALVDEQCSKAELMKFLTNRKNIYDIAKLLLPKRFEQTEINISKKWIEEETDIEFCSYEELLDYISIEYLEDEDESLMEYLDTHYETSDIFRAVERKEYQELILQAKSGMIQEIIDDYFIIKEEDI
jgi:hypothetical protein